MEATRDYLTGIEQAPEHDSVKWWPSMVSLMLRDRDKAHEIGQDLYDAAVSKELFPGEIACADFMRGQQTNPAVLLRLCRESQIFTAYAHWAIAFDMLSRGRRAEAEQHFAAIGQTGDFQHGVFWWGKAFHWRITDTTTEWLPWLDEQL